MTRDERRLELLEAFYSAWKRWNANPSFVAEQEVKEIAAKLDSMEVK